MMSLRNECRPQMRTTPSPILHAVRPAETEEAQDHSSRRGGQRRRV
jgi:hypothetical protein